MKAGFDTGKDRGAFSKNYLITFFWSLLAFVLSLQRVSNVHIMTTAILKGI